MSSGHISAEEAAELFWNEDRRMTTQKEFHELMKRMEELEKNATPAIWGEAIHRKVHGYFGALDYWHAMGPNTDETQAKLDAEFISFSREFIPLAIERIKRLERALAMAMESARVSEA